MPDGQKEKGALGGGGAPPPPTRPAQGAPGVEAVRACRRGGVSGDRAARQKKARAGGREEARDRKHDEKVYPIFKKRALGGAASAQGGGKRTAGNAGQRPECGPEEAGEFRRRAGAGSFRHDPG